ncbi:heme-degrading domain-containing protein [Cellulomonas gilvus]|uniref:Uncharacterized protein n=1 Tax=Cellulomonas gilvus (strain ATCC 13127 / NRRL B-14078) TaxID=593907 RepID=F8A7V6_CELGA|nr:heme-degrading domain-containing protein [Cellulomonas gilvus]AEI13639.1 protein of unknown function DUF336 [Cellulomonas gilvus ATCC 13127]
MTDDDEGRLRALVAELEAQRGELVLDRFTHDDAWELGSWLWRTAVERDLPVAISIRHGEQRVFAAARPGTSADNDAWIERKERLVRRCATASFLVGRRLALSGGRLEDAGMDPLLHAAAGGCVPVVVRDVGMVGTVTVSGLPQADDHALVVEALRALHAR